MHLSTKLLGISGGLLFAAACGGSQTSSGLCTAAQVSGPHYQYATNALMLPTGNTPYSIDIDGDGKPDNALANIVGTITAAMLDLQGPVNTAVAAGTAVFLIDEQAASLTSGCSQTTLNLAKMPATPPKFTGSDNFTINTSQTPAVLEGDITAGALSTILPDQQTSADVQKIVLNLPLASGNLPLTIYGAHVQGNISASGIMSGQIHGAIRESDINGQIIPSIATLLTSLIDSDPTGSTAMTIISLLVTDPTALAACNANPSKCTITAAEVSGNSLIGGVLAPDIQVFSNEPACSATPASCTWGPVPKGATKDALSVGLGFTAVMDTFQQ